MAVLRDGRWTDPSCDEFPAERLRPFALAWLAGYVGEEIIKHRRWEGHPLQSSASLIYPLPALRKPHHQHFYINWSFLLQSTSEWFHFLTT